MLSFISNFIDTLRYNLYELFHPKGKFFRLVFAFFVGMFFRIVLMDIEFFSTLILESELTNYISLLLVKIAQKLFDFIHVPVYANGRTLAIYDTVGVLVNETCLGWRGIIPFRL